MVPLVDYEQELEHVRVGDRASHGHPRDCRAGEYAIGTMIELPRACLLADRIAEHADFFSFGTNDLTQTGLGFSRDDIESASLAVTSSSDRSTARRSRRSTSLASASCCAWARGWAARPTVLELGVCGEHGGDPDSIEFFHSSGIDYVSCSPYRVPVARIAAAQAAIADAAATEAGAMRGDCVIAPT